MQSNQAVMGRATVITPTVRDDNTGVRMLQQSLPKNTLSDGAGYHSSIFSIGAAGPGVEAEGDGPFLPVWQGSPIRSGSQSGLNLNLAKTGPFQGVLPALLQSNEAVMGCATLITPIVREYFKLFMAVSPYRHDIEEYLDESVTVFAYPVFDSFGDERQLAGVIATDIYWKVLFANILIPSASEIICIPENSYNQTLVYRIDGPDVTYLGEEDTNDTRYNYLEKRADINAYVHSQAGPETRSYTAVPLSKEYGKYTLRIYPSCDTEDHFSSNKPWVYTISVASTFLFTSIVFVVLASVVERQQQIVMEGVVRSAEKAAATERELNEFLAQCRLLAL